MEIVDYARETRVARARVLENLYRQLEVQIDLSLSVLWRLITMMTILMMRKLMVWMNSASGSS